MVSAAAHLRAVLYVRQAYDLTGAYAISFRWWGTGNGETNIFRIQTSTGSLNTTFSDGVAEYREVYLPLGQFGVTGGGETQPDLGHVTGFFWSVGSPGLRKIGVITIHESPVLKCNLIVARSGSGMLKGRLTIANPGSRSLKARMVAA
jgi:hypothetical protein